MLSGFDIAADKAPQQQQQRQHVWSSAATAYEALALVRAALTHPSSSSSSSTSALTRSSFASLHATLHSAAEAYLSHLVPSTSSRHQRLIHERSRFHVSRTQIANTLAQGFHIPLQGNNGLGPSPPAIASAAAAAAIPQSASRSRDQLAIPTALSQQLYSALHQLHPSRPAQPPDPGRPASMPATTATEAPTADTKPSAAPPNLSLPLQPIPQAPSPRTSAALATLALTSLSNILTSPARSLFAFEVFAEHFDLDRASAGGGGGGTEGPAGTAPSPAGGVTSPSVAVSPAVLPPETADGGRAVSVIMIGGTVLVVDIEVGIRPVHHQTGAAAAASDSASASKSGSVQDESARLPAWAKEKGQLSWLPSVHVKITFATDTSSSSAANGQAINEHLESELQAGPTTDPAALAELLKRHVEVLAQLLLLGFPLSLELGQDQNGDAPPDEDVVMSEAADTLQQPNPDSKPGSTSSPSRHEKSAHLLHIALHSDASSRASDPQGLDPSLTKTHVGLYGEEYYLLAHYHLQAFILLLGRLARLDKERAAAGPTVASRA